MKPGRKLAEGEGFEPPVPLRVRLISSQVPSTTQPPFRDSRVFIEPAHPPHWQAQMHRPRRANTPASCQLQL